MVERRMDYLKPAEYMALRKEAPIAYIPWGAHEWHGVHNPLGTDALKSHRLCVELADRTGGVVLPAVHCGYPYAGGNMAPILNDWTSSNHFLSQPASTTTLSAQATDPELNALSYTWTIAS